MLHRVDMAHLNRYRAKGDLDNALKYLQDAKVIFVGIGAKVKIQFCRRAIDAIQSKM